MKFGKIAHTSTEENVNFWTPENISEKGLNQFRVSENIVGDTFQASQRTGDKEIAHKG